METIYGSSDDIHYSPGTSGCVSERVQNLASSVYREFEVMIGTYGDAVIKDLMPQVVAILESLNQAYREKQEHEVELELLRVENDNLKTQFEREKQLRKNSEQKFLEAEDTVEEERKLNLQKIESLEGAVRKLEVKVRNTQELVSRHEERERELKDENSKLHSKYSELFKNHVDYVERKKHQHHHQPTNDNSPRLKTTMCPKLPASEAVNVESALSADVTDLNEIQEAAINSESSTDQSTFSRQDTTDSDDVVVVAATDSGGHRDDDRTADDGRTDVLSTGSAAISDNLATVNAANAADADSELLDTAVLLTERLESLDVIEADTTSDYQRPSDEDPDVQSIDATQDDAMYQQCFTAQPFAGNISILPSAEFDDVDISENLTEEDAKLLNDGPSLPTLNMSIYEELSEHGTAVLGEVDSGADLTVAGVSAAVENLIMENNELLATKNALNVVKDDLIAQLDELTGEIDLLKEENVKLQQSIAEKSSCIIKLEDDLKKAKDADANKQDNADNRGNFTRIDLMRVLVERNQYKERLMELQDAVRRADMARAAAKEQQMNLHPVRSSSSNKPAKKKSALWGFFSELVGGDTSSSESAQSTSSANDGSTRSMVI